MTRILLIASTIVGLAGPVDTLAAETAAPASVREACMPSIRSLCAAEAMARDRPAVRACLIKNLEKATPECQAAVKAAAAQRPRG